MTERYDECENNRRRQVRLPGGNEKENGTSEIIFNLRRRLYLDARML